MKYHKNVQGYNVFQETAACLRAFLQEYIQLTRHRLMINVKDKTTICLLNK